MLYDISFIVSFLLASGLPFVAVASPVDTGPLWFVFFIVVLSSHLSAGIPVNGLKKKPGTTVVFLCVFMLFVLGRPGCVSPVEYALCLLWMFSFIHWFLALDDPAYKSSMARLGLAPFALLPHVVLFAGGTPVDSSFKSVAWLLAGFALAKSVREKISGFGECMLFRHVSSSISRFSLLVLPLLLALCGLMGYGMGKDGLVLFDDAHQSSAPASTDILPGDTRAEPPPGHGRLVSLVRRLGFDTAVCRRCIDPAVLDGVSILVVLMNRRPFEPVERRTIVDFVSRGGSLLVIGDHTDIDGTSSAMNPLLAAFGVRLRFDTVWRRLEAMVPDVRVLAGGLTTGLPFVYFSTGASIAMDTLSPLFPMIVSSSFLFSDKGDYGSNAFLGNGTIDRGESVGDLVLAAAGCFGRGRVVVLGDSAYLQNGVADMNRAFAGRLFSWLDREELFPWASCVARVLAYCIAIVTLFLVIVSRSRLKDNAVLLFVGLCAALLFRLFCLPVPGAPLCRSGPRMMIDMSHGNECRFFWSDIEQSGDFDVMDVCYREILALGWDVDFLEEDTFGPSVLRGVDVLLVPQPGLPYSERELAALSSFVEAGGTLLIMVGPGPGGGRSDLLPHFSLSARKAPLGACKPRYFAGTLPIELPYGDGPWPPGEGVEPPFEGLPFIPVEPVEVMGGRILAKALGRPVVTEKVFGRGKVVLFGDRRFLTDYAFVDRTGSVDRQRLRVLHSLLSYLAGPVPELSGKGPVSREKS